MTYFNNLVTKVLNESIPSIERDIISLNEIINSLVEKSTDYLEVNELLIKLINRKKNNTRISVEGKWSNPTNPNEVETVKPPFKCPEGQVKDSTGKCQEKKKPCIGNPVINPTIAPQLGDS